MYTNNIFQVFLVIISTTFLFYSRWILLISTFGAKFTDQRENYRFTPFAPDLGIYFEETAVLKVYHTDWHLTLRLDLTNIDNERIRLTEVAQIIKDACFNLTVVALNLAGSCLDISVRIDAEIAELERSNAIWFQHNGHRTKRGLINAIGEVSKTLFGTLSEEDAEQYLQNFERLEQQGKIRDQILSKHTTLLESSLSLIENTRNESLTKITNLEQMLRSTLTQWETAIARNVLNPVAKFRLIDATTILLMLINSYKAKQEQFLQALAFGGKNDNVALLIPPSILAAELTKISAAISGQSLTIPAPINEASMPLYYQIGTARSRIINNQLILSYAIPLADTKEFYLSKVTSFPHKLHNGLYNFIIPNHDFIAVDAYRQKFIAFTNSEISNCHDYPLNSNTSTLLCKLLQPILDISTRDSCEITLLTKEIASSNCDNRLTNITSELLIKLREDNAWIYVFPQKEVVYITCTDFPQSTEIIQGTGILRFSEECEVKSGNILVQAYKSYRTEIFRQIIPHGTIDLNLNHVVDNFTNLPQMNIKAISTPSVITSGTTSKLKEFSSGVRELIQMQTALQHNLTPLDLKRRTNYLYSIFLILAFSSGIFIFFICMLQIRKPIYRRFVNKPSRQSSQTNITSTKVDEHYPEGSASTHTLHDDTY